MKPAAELNINPILVEHAITLLSSAQKKLTGIWDDTTLMDYINRICPDRIDEVWRLWDLMGDRVKKFLNDEIPFCDVRLTEVVRVSPGVKRKNPTSCEWEQAFHRTTELEIWPDVWNTAIELEFLIEDLLKEFAHPVPANG